jgi:hypothetical protein
MDVKSFPDYDIYYTDPPWEQRMVKWFETKMRKDTGVEVKNDIVLILEHMSKLADKQKPIFIEYSVKGTEALIDIFETAGHKHHTTVVARYDRGKPHHMIAFNTDIDIPVDLVMENLVMHCVNKTNAKVVFDSFAGIGYTCKWVKKCGADYIGYELNPKRFERLIKEYDRT